MNDICSRSVRHRDIFFPANISKTACTWQHQVFLNPQRYCSFCTPKGGERLFHEVFPAITRLLGSTGVAPVKSVNTSIEIIYTLPATRCTVYSGEKELNFNIHGSDSSQKIYCRMFLRIVHSISFRKGIN